VKSNRRERVFIVRMWSEREATVSKAWRGLVHDISSGRKLYVTDPGEVAEFIAVHLTNGGDRESP
jgi:hypothetical protein